MMTDSPHPAARDELAGVVHLDSRRVVLVFRRHYAGRDYLRWRVWHRHATKGGVVSRPMARRRVAA